MSDQWYNEGGYIPRSDPTGYWVMYYLSDGYFELKGVFSSLTNARTSLSIKYEPQGLEVKMNSWSNEFIGVTVTRPNPGDSETELELQFYIIYAELDVLQ